MRTTCQEKSTRDENCPTSFFYEFVKLRRKLFSQKTCNIQEAKLCSSVFRFCLENPVSLPLSVPLLFSGAQFARLNRCIRCTREEGGSGKARARLRAGEGGGEGGAGRG